MQAHSKTRWFTQAAVAAVVLGAMALASAPGVLAMEESAKPAVIAAAFHADWCGACKKMGPEFMKTKKELLDEDILFVKFDLTNDETTHQSAMLAQALGLGEVWDAQAGKTGAVKVVDTGSGEVVTTLTPEHDAAAMKDALEGALGD
jgi:thiol-disulfide isomerase/thioredoxin